MEPGALLVVPLAIAIEQRDRSVGGWRVRE